MIGRLFFICNLKVKAGDNKMVIIQDIDYQDDI